MRLQQAKDHLRMYLYFYWCIFSFTTLFLSCISLIYMMFRFSSRSAALYNFRAAFNFDGMPETPRLSGLQLYLFFGFYLLYTRKNRKIVKKQKRLKKNWKKKQKNAEKNEKRNSKRNRKKNRKNNGKKTENSGF